MKARVNGIVLEPYFPKVRALDQKDARVSRAEAREFNRRHRRKDKKK